MTQLLEGRRSEVVDITVTEQMVRDYLEVIGADMEQLHIPVTMPFIFWHKLETPWLHNAGTLVHGEQAFMTHVPLSIGSTYQCHVEVKRARTKGSMQFLEHVLEVKDGDQLMCESISTIIVIGGGSK
ncbi:MaoC family dehydratase N-terminal domain-containing protein [Bacillus sp. CGMCC 1.16541]|uniref:FAS1-like dehydratase domain-containing protein n=1 Tax=Bacillus sp. CGMCC 1.16541 TaxID=2185143 RepID=UPI000D738AA7|nr:MaoC family dehydratase N-terminal domain-containing protein [Bacillus sp. CGMCC 1.16541]